MGIVRTASILMRTSEQCYGNCRAHDSLLSKSEVSLTESLGQLSTNRQLPLSAGDEIASFGVRADAAHHLTNRAVLAVDQVQRDTPTIGIFQMIDSFTILLPNLCAHYI